MKVTYLSLPDGHPLTAYLDIQEGEFWIGTNKHTDEPVKVYWEDDEDVRAWVEVPYES